MHANVSRLDVEDVVALYSKYLPDLVKVRAEQRDLHATGIKAQLDDIEAELTYLRLRETRPATVVELGALHGWSTSWILRALRDNEFGHLHSYDITAHASVPAELASRWSFAQGDAREAKLPEDTGYLFVDAAHTASFARWYLAEVFPGVSCPVSVHDVFHGRRALPLSEGSVVLKWLADKGIAYFTASRKAAPGVYDRIMQHRVKLGLAEPIHSGRDNPMIFFQL